ncbi:hypothetical protein AAEO56_02285 [Flavobacterium sp. DGU11]|uniref:Uncharacterized protein n=1 Tax=Flavobacterium arundinis TaxID=3139143 RepID=A0ABU9HSD1_9FLAO
MHSSIEEFIGTYPNCCESNRVVKENGKRFEIESSESFTKIKIDNCVIVSHETEKCDYGIHRISNDDFYFIELKGKGIQKGYDQLVTTINYFQQHLVNIPKNKRIGIIVSSKVPGGTDVNNLKQDFAKKYGKILEIKNKDLRCPPK